MTSNTCRILAPLSSRPSTVFTTSEEQTTNNNEHVVPVPSLLHVREPVRKPNAFSSHVDPSTYTHPVYKFSLDTFPQSVRKPSSNQPPKMPKPTILLVGGAFHPESYFRSLKVTIEQAGYPTSALSLPSAGAYPPECDFSEDVFAIRSRACELVSKGKRVVAVLHSYGAVPGIEALQGLGTPARKEKGVVFGLVFIAAMLPKKGDSFNKLMESLGNTTWKSMQERVGFVGIFRVESWGGTLLREADFSG